MNMAKVPNAYKGMNSREAFCFADGCGFVEVAIRGGQMTFNAGLKPEDAIKFAHDIIATANQVIKDQEPRCNECNEPMDYIKCHHYHCKKCGVDYNAATQEYRWLCNCASCINKRGY